MDEAPIRIRAGRAVSVIVHRVAPAAVPDYLEWEHGITQAAARFPGYRSTDVYPPVAGDLAEWVVVLHFDTQEDLTRWLASAERQEWLAKLPPTVHAATPHLLGGFAPWFVSRLQPDTDKLPPDWKMALLVLVGLYPTVIILHLAFGSLLSPLGFAFAMLISNIMSVSALQWFVIPQLGRLLRRWLEDANGRPTMLGTGVLIGLLLGLACLFREILS